MKYKTYPNNHVLRQTAHQLCRAITALAEMNIELVAIDVTGHEPRIDVAHCPGTANIQGSRVERGCKSGQTYVRNASHLHGCLITWSHS